MRREWAGLIRLRRWSELEAVAKDEPNQQLADTLAELELGLAEKADRRALRRILFLLARKGFTPSSEVVAQAEGQDAGPYRMGFLTAADGRGDTVVIYAREERGRVRWLTAALNATKGIVQASEETCRAEDAESFCARVRATLAAGALAAEVEPEYALFRIAEPLQTFPNGHVPPTIAYWRVRLADAEVRPHPSAGIEPSECDAESRRSVALRLPGARAWRLELGTGAPIVKDLHDLHASLEGVPEEERRKRSEALLADARVKLFTSDVVADHALRLRDLAFLLQANRMEGAGDAISAAEDLEQNGPESEYAKATAAKTVLLLAESWRRAAEARTAAPLARDA